MWMWVIENVNVGFVGFWKCECGFLKMWMWVFWKCDCRLNQMWMCFHQNVDVDLAKCDCSLSDCECGILKCTPFVRMAVLATERNIKHHNQLYHTTFGNVQPGGVPYIVIHWTLDAGRGRAKRLSLHSPKRTRHRLEAEKRLPIIPILSTINVHTLVVILPFFGSPMANRSQMFVFNLDIYNLGCIYDDVHP
jgi:hypothetical protein